MHCLINFIDLCAMNEILKYFPDLSDQQFEQLNSLPEMYNDWNDKINVISRKDIDNLTIHHILHSLSIAKYVAFVPGSSILDLGTGGGFPGIPLAILFPDVNFHLIDARKKKMIVVNDILEQLGLTNVKADHARAEELKTKYDFIVTRAVAPLEKLLLWTVNKFNEKEINSIPNGLICLKGGDLKEEIKLVKKQAYIEKTALKDYFDEPFFDTKYLLYLQV